jgi:CheY-like chemotaxis protein
MKRVFVVDDSETARVHLGQMLGVRYDVTLMASGEEALAFARENPPDAIVTDVQMPGMSGLDLLRALRGDPATKAIPVLVVTSTRDVALVNECRALGSAGFVVKPVLAEYLLARLGVFISH